LKRFKKKITPSNEVDQNKEQKPLNYPVLTKKPEKEEPKPIPKVRETVATEKPEPLEQLRKVEDVLPKVAAEIIERALKPAIEIEIPKAKTQPNINHPEIATVISKRELAHTTTDLQDTPKAASKRPTEVPITNPVQDKPALGNSTQKEEAILPKPPKIDQRTEPVAQQEKVEPLAPVQQVETLDRIALLKPPTAGITPRIKHGPIVKLLSLQADKTLKETETLDLGQLDDLNIDELGIEPSDEPAIIFEAYDAEFGEVQVPDNLVEEINRIDISQAVEHASLKNETVTESESEDELETEPEPIGDILSEEGILELLDEAATEQEPLPETTTEFVDFVSFLNPTEPIRIDKPETITALKEVEIAPLPPICIEVTGAIQKLQELEPEAAELAVGILQAINMKIDEVIKLRLKGSENAPEAEEKLQELCIKLFITLNIPYTTETVMEFVQGIVQAKQMAQAFADKTAASTEKGTHEIKEEHDPIFGVMFQENEDDLKRAIGNRAVQNYQFALAS